MGNFPTIKRQCETCGRPMPVFWPRKRGKDGGLVCPTCKEAEDRTASLPKTAHDSGDGSTIYHCPFCGSGQVTGRSDNTTECGYCEAVFTVQVQPRQTGMPQTIDGQHQQMPGMPGHPAQPGPETPHPGPNAPPAGSSPTSTEMPPQVNQAGPPGTPMGPPGGAPPPGGGPPGSGMPPGSTPGAPGGSSPPPGGGPPGSQNGNGSAPPKPGDKPEDKKDDSDKPPWMKGGSRTATNIPAPRSGKGLELHTDHMHDGRMTDAEHLRSHEEGTHSHSHTAGANFLKGPGYGVEMSDDPEIGEKAKGYAEQAKDRARDLHGDEVSSYHEGPEEVGKALSDARDRYNRNKPDVTEDSAKPAWLGHLYLTHQGLALPEDAFVRHLALRHTSGAARDEILDQVRAERITV